MTDEPTHAHRADPVHDPRVLRALAHPVRTRVLDELGATGPMRAADVAQALEIPANQASFHLRQLAKYGLVVEAPEEARDGRDRVWRAVHDAGLSINTHDLAEAPGGRAAVDAFRRQWTSAAHDAVSRAESAQRSPGTLVTVSDTALRLSRADAEALVEQVNELVDGWRLRGRGAVGEDVRTYQLLQILQPAAEVGDPPRA